MTNRPVTSVHLTVLEQSIEQYRSSSCKKEPEVLEKPKTENQPPPQQPAEILAELCQSADISITVFQAEALWAQIRSQLIDHDEQDVCDYFRWKLSDLQGTEYPVRAKLKFLNADVPKWLDIQRKRNVGRNDHTLPTETEIAQPAPIEAPIMPIAAPTVSANAAEHAQIIWANALTTLQATISGEPRRTWILPLRPIGIDHGTFHIGTKDAFTAMFVDDTYRKHILDALALAGAEVDSLKLHPELSI